jgi:membrane protease YdiL (CAAX protease family)
VRELERGRLVAWAGFVAAFTAISYTLNFTTSEPKNVLYTWGAVASGVFQYGFILGVVLLISRRATRRLLALHRPASWARALGISLAVLLGIFVLAGIFEPFLNPGHEQGLLPDRWEPAHAAAFAANFCVVAGVAPVVEELTFRGLGYSLLAPLGRWWAIVLVGVSFGLAHGLVEGLPLLAAIGGGLAYIRSRTSSVYPGMLVHAAFNGIVLAAAVTT